MAGLGGGGRPFTAGAGLIVRAAPAVAAVRDGDIGVGDIVRPPNEETEEYDPEEYIVGVDENGPVLMLGKPEIEIDCERIDALIEPGGELVGEKASGGEV